MCYGVGLVVWYVDDSFTDNQTGVHPGEGFLGVVDSHTDNELTWSNGDSVLSRFYLTDATFGLNPTSNLCIDYGYRTMTSPSQEAISLFNDSNSFLNTFLPDAGRKIKNFGLRVRVNGQAKDKSVGSIVIYK